MKKLLGMLLSAVLLLALFAVPAVAAEDNFHIAIITGSEVQTEDNLLGARDFQAKYGEDRVKLGTYPDKFTEEQQTTVDMIVAFAEDPLMKAIIVDQGVPGTAEGFQLVKEIRPDILCLAGQSHEDLAYISDYADLVIKSDFVARGYLIIHTAHDLGCDTFVHISFPRHEASEAMSRRISIMKAACEEMGIKFVRETAPDPTQVETSMAQAFIEQNVPVWVNEKYGKNAAFFCTNDAHTEPLIRQLLANGGYFIEADLPSPLMGYPGALGLDLSDTGNDFSKILPLVEKAVCEKGGAGRFGTWTSSFGYSLTAGLAQHAWNVIKGEAQMLNMEDFFAAVDVFAPGSKWNGSTYTDAVTGAVNNKAFLIYQDTYIMGNPGRYMNTTAVTVPEKYFTIR